jgi:hypothetical protein
MPLLQKTNPGKATANQSAKVVLGPPRVKETSLGPATRRLMASEREVPFAFAQVSISATIDFGKRRQGLLRSA